MFNRYIVVPFVAWAVTQFLKFILAAVRGKVDFRYLYASGGMPSVHSSVVTALAVTAFLVDGPYSAIFGLTIIFAAIVMYDSFGVRRSSGEQAVAINMIIQSMDRDRLDHPHLRLREILGHKPLEVTVGAVIGFLLACLLNYDKLGGFADVATNPVQTVYIYVLAAVAVILILGGTLGRYFALRRYRGIKSAERVVRQLAAAAVFFGILGLLLAFLQYERLTVALWVVWPLLYAAMLLVTAAILWIPAARETSAAVLEYQDEAEKNKWFEGPNRKRRSKRRK